MPIRVVAVASGPNTLRHVAEMVRQQELHAMSQVRFWQERGTWAYPPLRDYRKRHPR